MTEHWKGVWTTVSWKWYDLTDYEDVSFLRTIGCTIHDTTPIPEEVCSTEEAATPSKVSSTLLGSLKEFFRSLFPRSDATTVSTGSPALTTAAPGGLVHPPPTPPNTAGIQLRRNNGPNPGADSVVYTTLKGQPITSSLVRKAGPTTF